MTLVERLKAHVTYEYMPAAARSAMDEAAGHIERLEAALELIARGDVPPDQHGHYLAHRAAVKIARDALKPA
jgi:hypothetical protein